MTFTSQRPIQILAMTILLGLAIIPGAYAAAGDPMSRDIEFKESLTRHDDARESTAPGPVSRLFTRRGEGTKRTGR
jgi:hypothetical protein